MLSQTKLLISVLSLILLASFASAATTLNDSIIHVYNLTNNVDSITSVAANVDGATSVPFGKRGGSYNFDGNDHIQSDFSLTPTSSNNFTVNMWFNVTGSGSRALVSDYVDNVAFGWFASVSATNVLFMRHKCDGSADDTSSTTGIPEDVWVMATFVWKKTYWEFYLNGTLVTTTVGMPPCSANSVTFEFGGNNNAQHFDGEIDEVYVYDRSLNPAEIAELYDSDAGKFYQFEEPAVTPTFEDPTPADAATTTTQEVINVSCSAGDVSLWFDDAKVIDEQSSPADYTTNVILNATYEYLASCDNGVTNSSTRTWTYNLTPVYEFPTPTNAATSTTQQVINVSCTEGNVSLWFDDSKVLDQQTSPSDYTTSVNLNGTYEYLASCNDGLQNTTTRTWNFNLTSVFEEPTPPDAATNTSQVTINVSCAAGDVTLWFDDARVLDQQTSPSDYTTSVGLNGTYEYIASCDVGLINSSTRTWNFNLTPIFESPTPADGINTTYQRVINVSCAAGNVSLWFNGTNFPQSKVLNQQSSPADYTTVMDIYEVYQYWTSCEDGVLNSTVRTLGYLPTLILNMTMDNNTLDTSFFNLSTVNMGGTFVSDVKGNADAALYLDGASAVNVSESPNFLFDEGNFTIALWVNIEPLPATDNPFLSNRDPTGGQNWAIFWNPSTTRLRFFGADSTLQGSDLNILLADKWTHLVYTRDGTDLLLYIDGELNTTFNNVDGNFNWSNKLFIGQDPQAPSLHYNGSLDELKMWDRSLSASEIFAIFEDEAQLTSFVPPTPADGAVNNTQVNINVSCIVGSVSLWFDGIGYNQNKVIDELASPSNWTTNVTLASTYTYWASCDNGALNSSTRTWSYDIAGPNITINYPTNFFATDNTSITGKADVGKIMNFTIGDNNDLFAYEINITNSTGFLTYYLLNTSLSGTLEEVIQSITFANWTVGNYTAKITAADSHTKNTIKDYGIEYKDKEVIFTTEEGNEVSIKTHEDSIISAVKTGDRYRINVKYLQEGKANRRIDVKCDNPLYYREDSDYKGHFICANGINGNWLDFEGTEAEFTVEKLGDKHYRLNYIDLEDTVSFKSIGGLNTETQSYDFRMIGVNSTITTDSGSLPPQDNNALIGNCTTTNDNAENIILSFQWFKDDTLQGITTSTVSSSLTSIGEEWIFSCQGSFNNTLTDYVNSTAATIQENNYEYFFDDLTDLPIPNADVTVTYPSTGAISRTTDAEGKINYSNTLNSVYETGTYITTIEAIQGYVTPISYSNIMNSTTIPINVSHNISRARINIRIFDRETDLLITDNVTVSVANLFTRNTSNGTITIENISIASDTYDLIAESDNYFIAVNSFTFTNRQILDLDVYMVNSTSITTGNLIVQVSDNFFNLLEGANTKLLEYQTASNSFVEVGQCNTNTNGECIFTVELGTKLYIVTTSKEIDGVLFSAQSTTNGEIVKIDNTVIEMHLATAETFETGPLVGLTILPYNTTLEGNVSYLNADWYDVDGVVHTICISYHILNGPNEILQNITCSGPNSSGTVGGDVGHLLDRTYTYIARIYVLQESGTKIVYNTYKYDAVEGTFKSAFKDYLLKPIIVAILLATLALSLYMKNMKVFAFTTMGLSPLSLYFYPALFGGVTMSFIVVLCLCILYLTGKKQSLG